MRQIEKIFRLRSDQYFIRIILGLPEGQLQLCSSERVRRKRMRMRRALGPGLSLQNYHLSKLDNFRKFYVSQTSNFILSDLCKFTLMTF